MSDTSERERAVAAFLRDQAEREEFSRTGEVRRYHVRRVRKAALVLAWIGIGYTWLATPDWLTVDPIPAQTIVSESESLKVNVWLQSQRIEAYRMERGRLPYVLDDAGPRFRGMEYRRKDNRSYELTGRSNRVELRYDSRTAPTDFVGAAVQLLDDPVSDAGGGQ